MQGPTSKPAPTAVLALLATGLLLAGCLCLWLAFAPERGEPGAGIEGRAEAPVVRRTVHGAHRTDIATPAWVDRLHLLATTVSDDESRSRATIKDDVAGSRYVVGVDEYLPERGEIFVEAIYLDHVLLDDHGESVTLHIDPEETLADALEVPSLATMISSIGGNVGDAKKLASGIMRLHLARIGARDRDALQSHGSFNFEQPAGAREDEPFSGLTVVRVTTGSFYDQIGLKGGDILEAVNEHALDSEESVERAVVEFEEATELRLVIRNREGERRTIRTHTVPVR